MTGVFGVVTQYQTNIAFFLLFEGGYEGGIFVSEFTLYRSPRCTMYVLSPRLPLPLNTYSRSKDNTTPAQASSRIFSE
jgi:hypothetical protein